MLKKLKKINTKVKEHLPLLLIICLAFGIRLSGLTWAFPFNPHPDEWNMARAVSQLSFEEKLNPNFFAYGQFPLYLSYFSSQIYHLVSGTSLANVSLNEATFFLRFWSAIAGVGIVYLVYHFSLLLGFSVSLAIISSLLATFTPGLIQSSHFGTTESLLSFFFLAILYLSLKIFNRLQIKYLVLSGIFLGLALATKISAVIFSFPLCFVLLACLLKAKTSKKRLVIVFEAVIILIITLVVALISSPYLLLNFEETKRILLYEIQIARGQTSIFYTRQFIETSPVVFQLRKIFPYTLGLPIFIGGVLGFILSWIKIGQAFWKKSFFSKITFQFLTFNSSFLIFFLSQAFLFCKWTRFMAPLFAFFPIFTLHPLLKIKQRIKNVKIQNVFFVFIVAAGIFPGFIFFTLYLQPDIRFTASNWIYQNIPSGSRVLSDTGNVVDIPISQANPLAFDYSLASTSFDFYHLGENSELFLKLVSDLENADYIIVPSRRIFSNHLRLPKKYPLIAKYYELLFSGKLGFTQVAQIEPYYSKIFKDELAEETFSVFDHPTIRIYKKNIFLTKQQYEELF